MNQVMTQSLRDQLLQRRSALQSVISRDSTADDMVRLLVQVDQALERLDTDQYGRCVVCAGQMDDEEMAANPQSRYCLCDLTEHGRAELQRDLDLAWQVQASLLPPQNLIHAGWQAHYRYLPAGIVSGDYCDVIAQPAGSDWMYFLTGDVTGKGVAASYVMAQLSALVRRTLDQPVPVDFLLQTVNRHLSERSPETHFVTLVAGRAHRSGHVEISNAGHCRPVVLSDNRLREMDPTGIPVGISRDAGYGVHEISLTAGDTLVMYTDGVSEAQNRQGDLYGAAGLAEIASRHRTDSPDRLAAACLRDIDEYRDPQGPSDDLTLLVLRYQ